MIEKKNGGPAFPGMKWVKQNENVNPEGMSLRDYFAAHAPAVPNDFERNEIRSIVGVMEGGMKFVKNRLELNHEVEIRWRWHYADEMLKAREA